MSLSDLGKNDVSEESQALKDRLASQDTENAGLRTRLMRREAELEELQATLNETVYKLSKEAERALHLEEEVSAQSSELRTERISLRNTELALQSAQEKLKGEERAKKELESTLDTVSLHSQATSADRQSLQREKRVLESRVRELERIVQTHESKGLANISHKNGRPRSSSVSSFRLPAVEKELNDTKAQLQNRDENVRLLEHRLAQAQDDLVKAENACISIDKAGQKRISELLSMLERKEEELESLREEDSAGQREEELLKRIDEDAAKIAALEKLVAGSQASGASQTRIQKLQSQLKAEREKVHHSEDLQNQLLREKEELIRRCETSQREAAERHESLMARECRIKELEDEHAQLLAGRHSYDNYMSLPLDAESSPPQTQRPNGVPAFPDESALADHIQTLLQAIDRLRDERDGLKRALEFSEVEYRITTEGFQTQVASLTRQLGTKARDVAKPDARVGRRMKQLTSCVAAFTVVISNLQIRLDLSEDRLSAASADLAALTGQLHDTLEMVHGQKQLLDTNAHEGGVFRQRFDAMAKELSESDEECDRLRLQLVAVEAQVATTEEHINASKAAKDEAYEGFLLAEKRFVTLSKNYRDVESERNSLVLQVTNLQDDLARVQDDLIDAQNRYNILHAQQLSAMSASEVVQTLRDRIKELEARIVHCTDQIGDYQHDICRLEANVKHQEERTAETTSELELLASQKDAMVEDCVVAREARDEAIRKLEAAEEEAERIQQQLEQARYTHEAELSAISSTMANLTYENQQTMVRLADLETENHRVIHELDALSHDRDRLKEQLNAATSRVQSLELDNCKKFSEGQQAVISLAVIHRVYQDCARQLLESYRHAKSLQLQLDTLTRELQQTDVSTTTSKSQDSSQQDDPRVDTLQSSLQEKELELATAGRLLEETKTRYAEAEAELLERLALMTTELQLQAGRAEDAIGLQVEIETVRTQLKNSLENFANLEKLHDDVVQDFITVKEVFERRLTEVDEQLRTLETGHRHSLATMEVKYRHAVDILTSNLEDREHDVDELRQQFQDMSEAHSRAERRLHEESRSYEVDRTLASDLEKDLRQTVAEAHQQLAQTEAETLTLHEERHSLQAQITGLQAEIQRSTSLTRYLENQVRESEDACILLRESIERLELTLAESEKAGKAAEFNLTLQTTQHEKVVAALRREIASLQSGPELRCALADLEEKNREMDDLLRAKCQEIEEYDDRILETLKANKKLTSKVESLTRKVQALQAKVSWMKNKPQESVPEPNPLRQTPSISSPPILPGPATIRAGDHSPSHAQESPGPSHPPKAKTPEPVQSLPPRTPGETGKPSECEISAGKKRPAPDDDERNSVPAEGHYSTDACLRNGPTPRLRRTHGHPAGFTPVRGASSRKPSGGPSPARRANAIVAASEIITDVTNSSRGPSRQEDGHLKKRSWLGKIRSGTGSQTTSSRLGAFGGQ